MSASSVPKTICDSKIKWQNSVSVFDSDTGHLKGIVGKGTAEKKTRSEGADVMSRDNSFHTQDVIRRQPIDSRLVFETIISQAQFSSQTQPKIKHATYHWVEKARISLSLSLSVYMFLECQ